MRKRKVTITVETHRRVVIRRDIGQQTPVTAPAKIETIQTRETEQPPTPRRTNND